MQRWEQCTAYLEMTQRRHRDDIETTQDIVRRPIIGDFSPENYQNLVISGQNLPYIGNSCQKVSILGNKYISVLNQYLQELVKSPRFGKLNLHEINFGKNQNFQELERIFFTIFFLNHKISQNKTYFQELEILYQIAKKCRFL